MKAALAFLLLFLATTATAWEWLPTPRSNDGPIRCVNGAIRFNGTGYYCSCYSDWSGQACDLRPWWYKEVPPSSTQDPQRCVNGELRYMYNRYFCACHNSSEWTGDACDQRPRWYQEATTTPESQRCVNGYRRWGECRCFSDWTGRACDIPRCVNGYIAWNATGFASCRCNNTYWDGPACDRPFVAPNCFNGYRTYRSGRASCECYSGWTGEECQMRVTLPPENNTRCVNGYRNRAGSYYGVYNQRCECYDGWKGDSCDVRCANGYLSYRNNTCECYSDYTGWACTECINPDGEYPTCKVPWYKTVLRALEKAGLWTLDRLRTVNWVYVVIILLVAFIAYKMLRRSLIKAMKDRDAKLQRQTTNIAPPAYNERNCANNFANPNFETEPLIDLSTESVQPTIHATPARPQFDV